MTNPYRTAPAEQPAQKAPRASWWRRLWSRDVERCLDIRRRRHALRTRFLFMSWREAQDDATAVHEGYWRASWETIESESWETT